MDKSVGEVIDALKKKEILNNTIIVFFSDNGGSISSQILDNYGSNWPLRAVLLQLSIYHINLKTIYLKIINLKIK